MRLTPRRAAACALGTAAVAMVTALPASQAEPGPAVAGSVQQAYTAQTFAFNQKAELATDNTPALGYAGPHLELAATHIGRDAAEPTVGIDADGVAFMAAGAFDSPPVTGGLARTEVYRSEDGGTTWESVQTDVADVTTVPPTTLDPYVYVDEDTGRVFNPELLAAGTYLQFSDDKGETWTQVPISGGQPVNDHQTFVTGPPPEGGLPTNGYPNYVYYCFNRVADSSCGRSLDGGLTWLPAGEPAFMGVSDQQQVCGGLHGHIITDHKGYLYLPKGHCGYPWLAISDDGGQTWREHRVSEVYETNITHTAVDVDEDGTIYYLWPHRQSRRPLLSYSKDGGETWSVPVTVAPPGMYEANFPTIDAGKPGQIAISFPGTTVNDIRDSSRPWNYYVLTSLDADTPNPTFVSATAQPPSDPIHRGNCGPGRCLGMFDFIDVEFAPSGEIWAAATDTCVDRCVKEGTRAGAAEGVAVRQLSGPGLDAAPPAPPAPDPDPAPAPPAPAPAPAPRPGLPATGVTDVLLWSALAALLLGVTARRALRRSAQK